MTKQALMAAIREAARHTLFYRKLTKADFESWTIEDLRNELDRSLGYATNSEAERLIQLNVAIMKQSQIKGYRVEVPKTDWYRKDGQQDKPVSAIAEYIMEKEVTEL